MDYAYSMCEPYAWLCATGIKPIDNRNRHTNFRGHFYIHASTKRFLPGFDERWILSNMDKQERERYYTEPKPEHAIIGDGYIIDCVDDHPSMWFTGPHGLVIERPRLFANPIPYSGKLGFFPVNNIIPLEDF